VVTWFRALSTHSNIVQVALWSLTAVVVALAAIWAILNIEIILVVAVFALIVIAIDDIYTAFTGGKSVIGDFIDSIFGVGTTEQVVSQLKDNFNNLMVALGEVWNATLKLVDAFSSTDEAGNKTTVSLTSVINVIARVGHGFVVATQAITDFINMLTAAKNKYDAFKKDNPKFAKFLDNQSPGAGLEGADAFGTGITGGVKSAGGGTLASVDAFGLGITGGLKNILGIGGGGGGDVTHHTNIQVDVKTTGSPEATGNAVAKGVQTGISNSDLQAGYAGVNGAGGS
jgi:hypothetical protein